MTIEPFISRYRPDKWDEVIGNEDSVTSLRKVLAEDSSHAFLFTGPSGVGKTTVARLAAKELGTTADNLIEVDAATHNGVEEMRDLAETLKYRPLGASNIKSIIVDECFHPNHELLTRYGWKHINEVSENDEVMSFNGKTNECQFEPVLRTVQSQTEKLVELRGQQFHTLTTAGHEQPILNRNKELSRCFVKDLKKSYYLPIAGYIAETSRLSFEEKLKIAFEADGNLLYTNKTDGTKTYRFSFRRDRKIERLIGILTELNIPFKTSENSRFDTNIWFQSDIELTKTLLWFDPTQCVRRNIEFLNELVHWDRWAVPGKNECCFESRNEEIADLVQLTAKLSGCSASVKQYQQKDGRQPSWRVHWNTNEKIWAQIVQRLKITEVEYSGPVYCVTVPSGNVLTRLGKTISISGNCHSVTRQAWQSLLKIVEEPPSWAYWFFCTTDITRVPETIRTRCSVYSLKSLNLRQLLLLLEWVLVCEKRKLDETILDLCVKEARGSPRRALAYLGQVINCQTREEAASAIGQLPEEAELPIALARALVKGAKWADVQGILTNLKDENPEGIRKIVLDYITKVILDNKDGNQLREYLPILDEFSQPINYSDGIAPIVLASARCVLRPARID